MQTIGSSTPTPIRFGADSTSSNQDRIRKAQRAARQTAAHRNSSTPRSTASKRHAASAKAEAPKTLKAGALEKVTPNSIAGEATAVVLAVMLFKPLEKATEKLYATLFKNKLITRARTSTVSGVRTAGDKVVEGFQLHVATPVRNVFTKKPKETSV